MGIANLPTNAGRRELVCNQRGDIDAEQATMTTVA
jgi:hypothetical protein